MAKRKQQPAAGITFYVAPQGNDRWTGRQPAADGTNGPFATVARARNAVRAWRRAGGQGPVRVQLRAGTYELPETLEFTPVDGGTAAKPVVYGAFPGERPVLSGGRRLTGWGTGKVNGQDCWTLDLPEVTSGKWYFTQLFVQGESRPRPRLPKTGWYRFAGLVEGDANTGFQWHHGPQRVHYAPGEIRGWRNLDDCKVFVPQLWFDTHHRIQRLDEEQRVVYFRTTSIGSLIDELGGPARYCVENVMEALDTPGEWYLDRGCGRLYYLPRTGEDPATLEVIAPRLETVLRIAGTARRPVTALRFENLALQHAEWDYPPDERGSVQAAYQVPGAVVLEHATDCVFYGCEISDVAQYAVEMKAGCHGNAVIACGLHHLGGGGVKIGDEPWPPRATEHAACGNTVTDCVIHDGGTRYPSAIGVWVGNSGHNRIRHNHLYNLNYTGISVGWNWGYSRVIGEDNRIEHNHIHHINDHRILSDNGGIYTLGIQPGTIIRGNLIHDIDCYGYGGWGIYPDEGSSEMLVTENVVHHTRAAGYSMHYGRDVWVRNNIFALAEKDQVHPGKQEAHRSTYFAQNLVYWRSGGLSSSANWLPEHYTFRRNLFWNACGPTAFGDLTLAEWQQRGQHGETVVADPLFTDPQGGDFSLRQDSPALALGFKPIDLSRVGPRQRGDRPVSYAEWVAAYPEEERAVLRTQLELVTAPAPLGDNALAATVRVRVSNLGPVPASGQLRCIVTPTELADLDDLGGLEFTNLQPDEATGVDFELICRADAQLLCVDVEPVSGEALLPARLLVRPELRLPRLPAARDLEELATATFGRRVLSWRGETIGELELALSGEALAVVARLRDAVVEQRDPPWNGSSLELFASSVEARQGSWVEPNPGIGQVILVPGIGAAKAQAFRAVKGKAEPASEISIASDPTADGYELRALVPLGLLKVPATATEFRYDVAFNFVPRAGRPRQRVVLHRSNAPYADNSNFGRAVVS